MSGALTLIGIAHTAEGEPSQPSIPFRHTWISQDLRNARCLLKTSIQFSVGEGLVRSLLGLNVHLVFLKASFPSELFVVFCRYQSFYGKIIL